MTDIVTVNVNTTIVAPTITVHVDPNPWTPASEPGLLLYLDSSLGFTPAQWNDQSGNNNHATQGTTARQPASVANYFQGKPAIRFDGTKRMALTGVSRTTNTTVAFFGRVISSSSYQCAINTNGIPMYLNSPGPDWGAQLGSACQTGKRVDAFRTCIIRTNSSLFAAGVLFTTDGVTQTLSGTGFSGVSGQWLGEDSEPPFGAFNGYMAGVVVYDHALSDATTAKLNAWAQARWAQPLVVLEGDSIMRGNNSPDVTNPGDWITTKPLYIVNVAAGGNTIANMSTNANASTDILVYPATPKSIVCGYEMVNSVSHDGWTGQQCYDALVAYYQARKAAGWKVIVMTQMSSLAFSAPGYEASRQFVNTLLRANWQQYGDYLADVGADATMGQPLSYQNTTYFLDSVHPTDAGNQIFGSYIQAGIDYLINH